MLTDMNKESGDVASRMGLHNKEGTGVSHPLVYGIVAGATLSMTLLGLSTSGTGAHRRLAIASHDVTVGGDMNSKHFMSLDEGSLGISWGEMQPRAEAMTRNLGWPNVIKEDGEEVEFGISEDGLSKYFKAVESAFEKDPSEFEKVNLLGNKGKYYELNDVIGYKSSSGHTHIDDVNPLMRLLNIKQHLEDNNMLTDDEIQQKLISIAENFEKDSEWRTTLEVPEDHMKIFTDIDEEGKFGWGFYKAPEVSEVSKVSKVSEVSEGSEAEVAAADFPVWAIIVIVVASLAVLGVVAWLSCRNKSASGENARTPTFDPNDL